ncbi:GNAT family N-acetyltransferase [Cellulomonas humilata]|uniref:Acetyltransferase n=1 Tax=Cellulomonas humilata TaxID=144055 RepID=A0ABU0EBT9_9CELL|nr:GNAT family N-acetyltransferase [Cellulomonas humilata]MDQ0372724.1 putative acetyltransferase [Cellulomonas humilata]
MTEPSLRVRVLTAADEAQARAAHETLADDGVEFCLGLDDVGSWAAWLEQGERLRAGEHVPPRVPETFVGGFVGSTLVGRLSVRHELTERLALVGGHLGYAVLPEHRRRGYAGDLMREGLRIAREVRLDRVLVTCSPDNIGSVRTIEQAGGVLQDVVAHPTAGLKRRYWIALVDGAPAGTRGRSAPTRLR